MPRPDPGTGIPEQLAAAGLLASTVDVPDVPSGAALEALEAEVESWLESLPNALGLVEAVQADRNDR